MSRLIFEISKRGKTGLRLPAGDIPVEAEGLIDEKYLRKRPPELPEVSEPEVVRHFRDLADKNFSVDKGFYPLGSCTMKYNPKVNEDAAGHPRFAQVHPLVHEERAQGWLEIMFSLEQFLSEISGMHSVSLQPAAGAQGELAGMLIVAAYHRSKDQNRTRVLVPDSAHGTNPASVVLAGLTPVEIKCGKDGRLTANEISRHANEDTAALLLTNPNTLGIFETEVQEICEIAHSRGALVYMDGANMNALLGIARPADMGFDIVHFNLHKTFSTPHGGGGPGSGPIGVTEELEPFLPVPVLERAKEGIRFEWDRPLSIGKLHTFYGNASVALKAYCYIRMLGRDGLEAVSRNAILNANYLRLKLECYLDLPYKTPCQHEFVLSASNMKKHDVRALDIAKRLLDYGFHAPTMYFPLLVKEALMIEPTETESLDTLLTFADAVGQICREAQMDSEKLTKAPWSTPVRRLDEVKAAKDLDVCWEGNHAREGD